MYYNFCCSVIGCDNNVANRKKKKFCHSIERYHDKASHRSRK